MTAEWPRRGRVSWQEVEEIEAAVDEEDSLSGWHRFERTQKSQTTRNRRCRLRRWLRFQNDIYVLPATDDLATNESYLEVLCCQ